MSPCRDGTQAHHWMLGSPNGSPWVQGRCRRCGKHKGFPASWKGDWAAFSLKLSEAAKKGNAIKAARRGRYNEGMLAGGRETHSTQRDNRAYRKPQSRGGPSFTGRIDMN